MLFDMRNSSTLAILILWGFLAAGTDARADEISAPEAAASEAPDAPVAPVAPVWMQALDNEYYKIDLNVRARIELADIDGFDHSEAYTVRIRAGIGSKPLYGFTGYAELENMNTFSEGDYFNGAETPTGQTIIADPEVTELNQLFLNYEREGLYAKVGRQRLTLDNQRFVGNVGWRQNEQTFDAAWLHSSLNIEGFDIGYGYLEHINRIFGDKGSSSTQDWDSDSHIIHASYAACDCLQVTAFAYIFDFEDDSPTNSANSYGLRVTGSQQLGESDWSLKYAGSYARQADAGKNPVDYTANYGAVDSSVSYSGVGEVGAGYEFLGSDDGKARFVTPLATAHKFNGYADAFVDNGGVDGLQDFYVYLKPQLPWTLKGALIYHRFWSDYGGNHLASEWDAVLEWPVLEHVTLLTKGAYFEGTSRGPADRWRYWFEVTFNF